MLINVREWPKEKKYNALERSKALHYDCKDNKNIFNLG
jgi:hypothetical protein